MNPFIPVWIGSNIFLIPFMVFGIAPLFIADMNNTIDWVYDDVNDEGKKKFDELREQYTIGFYVVPIILTNVVVGIIFVWKGRSPKQNAESRAAIS